MQHAIFYKLVWEKGEGAHLVQGVKNNQRPSRALYGGNGSFMVAGSPARLYLTVKGDDGKYYRNEIYSRVMNATNRKRMSDKLYDTIYSQLEKADFSVVADHISWDCKLG